MSPRGDEPVDFVYDRYLIHTKDVDRNGESVTLEVMLNTAPRRITIRRDETVTIGDIGIKNTPMGHKIMEDGTEESFVMLTFSKGDVIHSDTLYNGDSTTFEYLAIQAIHIESDGEGVILEVRDTRIPLESLENPDTQTLEIKNGETITVFDLTLTHKGGGHEMADNGNDPSWINLVLSTPRVSKFYHWNNFANESKNPDADIFYDNYVIRVIKVGFD